MLCKAVDVPPGFTRCVACRERVERKRHAKIERTAKELERGWYAAAYAAIKERTGITPKGLSRAERNDIKARMAKQRGRRIKKGGKE